MPGPASSSMAQPSAGIDGAMPSKSDESPLKEKEVKSDEKDSAKKGKKDKGATSRVVAKLTDIEKTLNAKDAPPPPWIKTSRADTIFGGAILLNAIFIGVDLEFAGVGFNLGFWLVESAFLVTFFLEIFLRLKAERPNYRKYFDYWGIFDVAVTVLGALDAWLISIVLGASAETENPVGGFAVLRIFRLVRLVRLLRVLRMFSELIMLVHTLGDSMRAVGWMSLLLLMITYTGSIITVLLLGGYKDEDPRIDKYFGSLGKALFSHFCVVTLEGWPDIASAAMDKTWLWGLYFVMMIALTNFALVNLMVGVIVERIIHLSLEQDAELSAFVAESEQFRKTLKLLWEQADKDGDRSGDSTRLELRALLAKQETKDVFGAFGINLNLPDRTLYTIMNLDEYADPNEVVSFEDFFAACLRLCGSKQNIHSMFVQHDICAAESALMRRLDDVEGAVSGRPVQAAVRGGKAGESQAQPAKRNSKVQEGKSPEEAWSLLMDRIDQFGRVQNRIFDELQELREQAKKFGFKGGEPKRVGPFDGAFALVTNKGTDLGSGCCITDVCRPRREAPAQSRRSSSAGPASGGASSSRGTPAEARKALEAEWRGKKGR